ncbi:MAG TPA: chemotaxis protein CheR, partial [Alteromonas sp.]|nr:chemotaxis protein CheR [Alteromonas sp.]
LVRSRLGGLLHERQLNNIDELLRQSISGRDRGLLQQVIDAMTT